MSIQNFSVKRPITLLMFYMAGIIFGIISLSKMDVDLLPPIRYPEISVITLYMGASPKEIETLVTRPVEEAVSSVSGVKRVRSESIEGASLITASFEWGTDMDFAAIRIREKVDMVKGLLPQDAEKSIVARFDPNSLPIMGISINSKSGEEYSIDKIRKVVEKTIKPKFERIDGIGSVKITGGKIREVQVVVDLSRLYAYGLSIHDVIEKINLSNYNFPAGNVIKGKKEFLVRTIGEFKDLDDIRNVLIKKDDTGKAIYVKEVAEVRNGFKDRTSISFFNGKESVGLSIIKEAGKNTVTVCKKAKNLTGELNKRYKGKLEFSINYDGSGYIESAVNNVSSSAILGGIIAFIIIFLFLRDIKNSLVIVIVLPTSILITMLIMYIKGITLNIMSLGGLALGVGMLVDSGIVVIESIKKEIEEGKEILNACVKGVTDVMAPLLSSTLTSIVVFLPIIFVSGIAGEVFSELAFTVSISLVTSYVVSITLIPAMVVMLSKVKKESNPIKSKSDSNSIAGKINIAGDRVDSFLKQVESSYSTFLSRNIKNFKGAILAGFASVIIGILVFMLLDSSFLPETDSGTFTIRVEAGKGTPLIRTEEIMTQIDRFCAGKSYIENRSIDVGFSPGEISEYFGREKNRSTAEMLLTIKENEGVSTKEAIEELRSVLRMPDGVTIEIFSDDREFAGISNMVSSNVSVDVFGDEFPEIDKSISSLVALFNKSPDILNPSPVVKKGKPEIKIDIDKKKLASFGLNLRDVAGHIRASIKGEDAGKLYKADEQDDISVRLRKDDRKNISQINDILIKTSDEKNIPLRAFAETKMQDGYSKITRKNQRRCFSINCDSKDSTAATLKSITGIIDKTELPGNTEASIASEIKEVEESISGLVFSLVLSILLIYMILAAQFESLTKPLLIMLSVPLTISGISISLLITGNSITIVSVMGMVMLSGIVVNNAIVLIEYIRKYRDEGIDLTDAVCMGSKERLRPIVMTTLTTMLGLFPLALGLSEGGEIQAPQAITVIGGLFVSTVLTLVLIPIYYYRLEK